MKVNIKVSNQKDKELANCDFDFERDISEKEAIIFGTRLGTIFRSLSDQVLKIKVDNYPVLISGYSSMDEIFEIAQAESKKRKNL